MSKIIIVNKRNFTMYGYKSESCNSNAVKISSVKQIFRDIMELGIFYSNIIGILL